jgi:putative hydrolase of the HAD superfamily
MADQRQVLLIDADDTLWETNRRFQRTFQAYFDIVASFGYSPEEIRRRVNAAEHDRIRRQGYGESKYIDTLVETYRELAGPRAQAADIEAIRGLSQLLFGNPLRIFDGVRETLAYLAERHRLFLFTKGDFEEQGRKVAGTDLGSFFESREIVPEKTAEAYRGLVGRHGLPPDVVWMVGDSPRSDINPALAAGLNAVYIPAEHPWEYEHEEIRPGRGRLLVLARFSDLREHF